MRSLDREIPETHGRTAPRTRSWHSDHAAALLLVCVAFLAAAGYGQDALAQLYVESAHYYASDGAVEVRLDGSASWVNPQGIRLVGADGGAFVTGAVFHSGNVISITLGGARGDFEGLGHPRYVVVRAGGINGTDGVYNAEDLRAAISYDDTAPPQVSSAEYDAGTGILSVSFSEAVWGVDMDSVRVYGADGAGIAVAAGRHGSGDDAAYVDLEPGAAPATLSISAGGVSDIWGNANSAELSGAVSVIATVPPPTNSTISPPTNSTISPPINGTISPPINGTISPPTNSTISPPINGTISPPTNSTISPPINGTISPPINGTISPPINGTISPPINGTISPPINGTISPPINGTISPPINGTISPPINGTISPPINGTISPPINGTISPPINGTISPPINGTISPPINGTISPPINGTISPPINGTISPPINGTISPPINGTISPPINGTISPPTNSTISPPINGTISPPTNSTIQLGITSAVYDTNVGRLDITVGNTTGSLTGLDAGKFGLVGTGGADVCNGNCTVVLTGNATISVEPDYTADFEGVAHPRYVTVGVGGLSDQAGPNTAKIREPISYSDVSPPGIASAVYNITSGTLAVSLSERALLVPTSVTLADSLGGALSPKNVSHTSGAATLTIVLSYLEKILFENMTHPRTVVIAPGGMVDIWGNAAGRVSHAVSYAGDETAPAVRSAVYDSGVLNVTLDERTVPISPASIILHSEFGDIKVADSEVRHESHSESFSIVLSEGSGAAFDFPAAPPAVSISAGGLEDIWGNANSDTIKFNTARVAGIGSGGMASEAAMAANAKPTVVIVRFYPSHTEIYDIKITFSEAVSGSGAFIMRVMDGSSHITGVVHSQCASYSTPVSVYACRTSSISSKNKVAAASNPILEIPGGNKFCAVYPNCVDAVNQPIIIYESVKPTLSAAAYYAYNGTVVVTFSEDLFTANGSKMHIHDTGSNSKVALTGATHAGNKVTVTLGATDKTTVNGYAAPQLDIDAGAVADMSGNDIAGAANQTLTKHVRPTITGANYYTGNGTLLVTFSATLDKTAHDATKMHIRNAGQSTGGVTLSNGIITTNGTDSIKFDLGDADTNTVNAMSTPRIVVDAGAITDQHGNSIASGAASLNVTNTDKPVFVGAKYHYHEGILNITFSKPLSAVAASKISVTGATQACTFSLSGATHSNDTVTSNLGTAGQHGHFVFCGVTTAKLSIGAGAVSDTGNRGIDAASNLTISVIDNTKPRFVSAIYYAEQREILAEFSERVTHSNQNHANVRDIGQSTGGILLDTAVSLANRITYQLSATDANTIKSYQRAQLDLDAGAISDLNGNLIDATLNHNITMLNTKRPVLQSATYYTGNGTLVLAFTHYDQVTPSKLHVHDMNNSTKRSLASPVEATYLNNTAQFRLIDPVLGEFNRYSVPQLDVAGDAVRGLGTYMNATSNFSITVTDTTKPTFVSASYTSGNSSVTIRFSEAISSADASKMHIRDTGQSAGGITLSSVTVSGHTVNATLSSAQRATLAAMTTPQLDIGAGAASDSSGNQIAAAADQTLTVRDTAKPTFVSAAYYTGNGTIKISFSEAISSADASKIHIRDTGQSAGGITLSSVTVSGHTVNATLSSAQRTTLAAMTTPQLDIGAGAVSDSSSNQIAAAADQTLTVQDTAKPTFVSAAYYTGNGTIKISFSEAISSADASKIHIRDTGQSAGGITLSSVTVSGHTVNATLSSAQRTTLAAMTAPQLDIGAGAVSDSSSNQIAAAADQTLTVRDTVPPRVTTVYYYDYSQRLVVSFDEALDQGTHNASKFHIGESGSSTVVITLSNPMIIQNSTNYIIFKHNALHNKFISLADPRLDVDSGAVRDSSGNPIAATTNLHITKYDFYNPTFVSATYATATGILTISFNEALNQTTHDASKIHIRNTGQSTGGVTLSNALITANGTTSITFDLGTTDTNTVNAMATPQIDIEAGAVRDTSGNQIAAAADQTITINDTIKPTFSSASYTTGSGELTIIFSEPLDSAKHVPSKFHIRESGSNMDGVTLSNGTITANGTNSLTLTLSSSNRTAVAGLTTPQLDIEAGAVSDTAGNQIAAAADQTITVNDTIRPTFTSASYTTGSGELTIVFSEPLNTTMHVPSKFHIRESGSNMDGVTLSNGTITANGTNSLTLTLSSSNRTAVAGLTTPQLDIEAGAVSDTAGNQIAAAADQTITVNDTIKPTFSSASYTTGSGELTIIFSEPLNTTMHVPSKFHIRESGSNSDGVTLSNGTITTNGTSSLTITLSSSNRTAVAGLTTPQLDIEAGAVSDTAGNQIAAAADQTITVNDTIKPTFSSASYTTGSGELTIVFSEPLNTTMHVPSKFHIRESGSNSDGVTLSNGTITANGTSSLTITLSSSNRTAVAGLTTPQLDIDAGAVSDTAGNQIAAAADQAITVHDTIKPTFSSASYTTGSGELTIVFSEPLDSAKHVPSKFHIRESGSNSDGVTLSNGTITANGTNSLTLTLSSSNRTAVAGLTTPQLDIDAGAVSDTAGNQIAAAADQAITVHDTIKPTFSSASYTTGSGELTIVFSEPLNTTMHVPSKFHIRESGSNSDGVTLSNGTITTNGTSSLTITLSSSNRTAVAGLTTPQLDIDAGAVSDTAGNQIAAAADQAITVHDTIKPTFSSASYTTGSGELTIVFSEPLNTTMHVPSKFHIRESGSNSDGVTLSNGTITTNGTSSLTITLSSSNRTAVAGLTTPQLDIDAGAVSDTAGNQIAAAADQAITVHDTIKPTFSSASYTTGSGELTIVFSEPLNTTMHVPSKFHIRESGSNSDGVTLSNGTITTNGTSSLTITLSSSNRTAVAGLTTPQLDIDAGAVSDTAGNQIAAAADQAITVHDTIKPTFSSASYTTGSGELTIVFSEPLNTTMHVPSKFHIRESGSNSDGVTLSNGTITTNGTSSLTITLSSSNRTAVAGLTTPQLDIEAGAVSDTAGNQIAAAADQTITVNDTIKPTFSSASYTTGSGELTIVFSEPLNTTMHVPSKFHIRESGSNMDGVTLSNGTITANGTNSLTLTLSSSNRTAVAGLTTPQLDIDAGAVSDTAGNQIAAAADQAITVHDTIKPTFSSASYTTGSGELTIIFSEPLNTTMHVPSKFHIRESGSNSDGVTLSNGTITTNGTSSLTITLSSSNRTAVAGLTTPQLDIEAGAVSDTAGNQIAAAADQAITVHDTIKPTFSSASYTTGSGELTIVFSEPLNTTMHVPSKFHIRESGSNMDGVTLSNGTITANGTNSLTLTLSSSNRTAVAGLTTPQLDIDAGAVSDTAGNQIAAAADQAITVHDTIKPTFSSASYTTGSGELTIIFSEPLNTTMHVPSKFHIRESGSNSDGVTLSNGTITANGTNSLTLTLSSSNRTAVAGLTTPQLDIEAGAVSDTAGNQIAAAADQTITINDTIRPTFTSASYTTGSGELTIVFSEPLNTTMHVPSKFHIRESGSNSDGVTLSNGTITANGTNSLTLTLSSSNRTAVAGLTTPQLDIDAGAVSDTAGNQIAAAADQAITVHDTIKPTFSSASYTTGSGELTIVFSEPLNTTMHVPSKFHIRESGSNSDGVTLSNGTITANGTNSLTLTLSSSNRTAVAGLTTPQLDIDAGAVSDTAGNQIAAAADQAITVHDTIKPTFSSASYTTGSGELTIIFSEPLNTTMHVPSKFHIRESGSNSDGVTLSNGTITANGTNSLTLTLSSSNRTAVAGLTTPQLDIEAGAVSDTAGNQIAAAADQTITINDTIRPTFTSASYTTGSGELTIVFSEPLDSAKHVPSKFHIRESGSNSDGVTLSNGTITANGTNSLTLTLSSSNRTAVAGLTTPQLDIDAGAVSDTAGNQIAAAADQTITINDTIRPTFTSASYTTGSGELTIVFSEPLDSSKHVPSKFHIRESGSNSDGVTLSNGTITANGTNSLTLTLSSSNRTAVAGLTTPQLDIDAGAVSDTAGNQIAAAADQTITINDTIRPTFTSASYTTGSGELTIIFSEPLDSAKHVPSKFHIRESGSNSDGVTLSNGTITANGTSSLTITLSSSNRTAVAGLTTPQLDIDAGAVSDTAGNQIAAAADQAITVHDTIKPTFSSASYTTGSGELTIIFSEPLDSAKHVPSKFHIRESGSNSDGVTLSNGTITANGTSSLTITLSSSNRTAVAGLTTPQLDIEAGAVSDTAGNQIAAAADQTITINDTIRPTFTSASYTTGSGELTIVFSEPLDSAKHVPSKFHIRESGSNSDGVTLSNGTITTNGTSSLTITLSSSNRTAVAGLTTPQLDIDAGAVSDTAGNQIAAAADQTITVNDTIRPTFTSASYTTGSGELTIIFSEPLNTTMHVPSKFHIRESGSNSDGVTLSNGTITTNGTSSLTITLSSSNRTAVAGLTTPQLDIDAGAVSDTAGNQIAAAADQTITVNDTIKPTFSSASYTTGSGELTIVFSEPLNTTMHVPSKFHIRESGSNMDGVTLSNGTITANGTNSLTLTLSSSNRTAVAGLTTPQLDIDAGAVSDTAGNQIAAAADQAITVHDTIKPTFSSASYTTGSGELTIVFSEPLDTTMHVPSKFHIRESGSNSDGVTLSNGTITTNGTSSLTITLSSSNRTAVAGLTTPQLDIDAGAVSDTAGNQIAAAADQTITVNDTIKPTFSSASYTTGSGELTIVFSEPLNTTMHVPSKFHIRESGSNSDGVTLSNGTITTNGTSSLTITLSSSNRTAVAGLTTPQLDIDAGAVSDTAGNQIAAAADQTITVNDTIKPTFSSASYTTGSGELTIVFSEPLNTTMHVPSKFHIRESGSNSDGVTLSNGTITANGTNSLTLTLSSSNRTAVAGLTTPQLDIDAGAVSDTAGNQIAAAADQAITVHDTIRPTFTSASYTTGSGELTIVFSEPLNTTMHVPSKFHIRESGSNSDGVTLSNGTITANGTSSLTITLSSSNRTAVAGLTTPQLDIEAGAVSDTAGNQIAAAADQTITINDTIRPTFTSASYTTGSGELTIVFSEPLNTTMHVPSKFHIRESGSNSDGVTLSNGTITTNGTSSLTITLSSSNRTAVAGLTTPQLDIEAGAVSDTAGNQIAAAADQTITVNDTIKPTFSSASYTTGSGELTIVFSEPLDSSKHVPSKFHIRESGSNSDGVTLSNGTITANGTSSLTITLSSSNRTAVAGLTTPQLDIEAGAVSDTAGNQIAAAADQTITVNDTIRPTFTSASYTTGSGELTIVFSEPLNTTMHVPSKFHIRESGSNMDGVTLSNGTITANGTNSLTLTLSSSNRTAVAGLTTPQLDIEAGAVSDTAGNQIAAAADQTITVNDTIKPTFSSASYTTGSGELTIVFSEPLDSSKHVPSKFHIRESGSNSDGVTLSNGTITTNGTSSLTITLSSSNRTAVAGLTTPQLDIEAGAVSDTAGNQIAAAADQAITVHDTIKPTFSSASYTTGSGELTIVFSEPLNTTMHVPSKFHIRESGSNSDGVTLSNGTITANGTNSLTLTLSSSNRTAVAGLTTPQLDIDAGAVSDTAGNQIAAAADQTITINDTIRPTFTSASYTTGSGELTIVFSEPLDSSKHVPSKFHIRESGSNSDGVTLSNGTITANGTNSLTLTLSSSNRTAVAGLTTPQLDIDAGAVSDTAGNQIAAAADQTITINDTIRPTFTSASYTTGSGELTIVFSEPLDSAKHVPSKFHIRESGSNSDGVTLSNGTITANGTNSLTLTLSSSNRTAVAGLTTPQLDIDAGAVSDTAGNQIAAAADQTITINDTIRPTFTSASYTTGSGELTIVFSEPLDSAKHVPSKFHIRESGSNMDGVTLSNGTITANGTNSLTLTLSSSNRTAVAGLTTPQLDIDAGAVSDTAGNQIAAAADQTITINDTIKPTFSSASYTTGSGELTIVFSEPLDSAKHVPSKFHIRESGSNMDGVTLSNGTITTNGTNSLTLTLSSSNRTAVAGLTTPQLDIDAGAVSDTAGNQIAAAADQTITINDTIRPTFTSASYTTGSGELTIVFSEPLDSAKHVPSKFHIRESGSNSDGVTLSNGTITTNGTNSLTLTLSSSNRTAVAGLTTPQLDIDAGAVSDTAGNQIAAAADQTITINDTIKPTFSSASYTTGSGELTIIFSEPLDSSKHVPSKFHIRESGSNMDGVTLSNGTITTNGTNSLTLTLSSSNRTAVAGLTTPQLDIDAGAVSDTAGNAISAISDQSITIIYPVQPTTAKSNPAQFTTTAEAAPDSPQWFVVEPDRTPPLLRSATYDMATSKLDLMFDEAIDVLNASALVLARNDSTLPLGDSDVQLNAASHKLSATLGALPSGTMTYSGSTHVFMFGGAVSDAVGNEASIDMVPVTVTNSMMPVCNGAKYFPEASVITLEFDHDIEDIRPDRFHIWDRHSNDTGITLDSAYVAVANSSLSFSIDERAQESLKAMVAPRVDMEIGAVRTDQGFMSMEMEVPVVPSPLLAAVQAPDPVVYSALTDTLWLGPDGYPSVDTRKMVLRNETYSFPLEPGPLRHNGASGGAGPYESASYPDHARLEVGSLERPSGTLVLEITGGPVSNGHGSNAHMSVPVRVFEGITARLSTSVATGLANMTDIHTVAAGHRTWLLAVSAGNPGGMAVLDVTGPGGMGVVFFEPVEGPVGMDIITVDGTHYAAVLAGAGLTMFDITQPTFPEKVGFFGMPSDWMFITAAAPDGAPLLILQDSERFKILDVSNPANPVLVTSALLLHEAPYLGMDVFGDGAGQYAVGSLAHGNICITDVSDPLAPVGECSAEFYAESNTRDVGVLHGDDTLVLSVSDGRTPGMTVYNVTEGMLEAVSFVHMPHLVPWQVETLELYGTPYALVLAPSEWESRYLLAYDLSDVLDPVLVIARWIPDSTGMHVDVSGDSARLLLVDASGAIHTVLLDGAHSSQKKDPNNSGPESDSTIVE